MTVRHADDRVLDRHPMGCDACGSTWLAAEPMVCPLCHRDELVPGDARVTGSPERVLPFAIDAAEARRRLADHVASAPMAGAPRRLDPVPHYIPMWLVDAHLLGTFQAEVGFDYTVQSHVEICRNERWSTTEVEETRIRWEPRAGTIDQLLHNEATAALATWEAWQHLVQPPSHDEPSGPLGPSPVLLPDRPPSLAWPDAEAGLRRRSAALVQQAARAAHVREFYLEPTWQDPHWTWVLIPVYSASYVDDRGQRRVLRVDGRSGRVRGPVVASRRKGWAWAAVWALLGSLVLAVSLVSTLSALLLLPLLLLSFAGGALGFALLGLALVPPLRVWWVNRTLPTSDPMVSDGATATPAP